MEEATNETGFDLVISYLNQDTPQSNQIRDILPTLGLLSTWVIYSSEQPFSLDPPETNYLHQKHATAVFAHASSESLLASHQFAGTVLKILEHILATFEPPQIIQA